MIIKVLMDPLYKNINEFVFFEEHFFKSSYAKINGTLS